MIARDRPSPHPLQAELARKAPIGAAFLLSALLTACSPEPRNVPAPQPEAPAPAPRPIVVERVLDGGGLAGLPGLGATLLPAAERDRLMPLAYPGQPSNLITVRDGDALYNARPLAAFRLPDRIVLLVQNASSETCHACSGRTSVFYFDPGGQRLTHSFPLALDGADWGQPQEIQLVDVGGPSLLLHWDFQQQGYYFEGHVLYRLGGSRIEPLAEFPSLGSNDGTIDPVIYRVQLAGAGLSADGRSLTLRYAGRQTTSATGAVRQIEEDRSVTLDGVADAWVQPWGHSPW